MGLEPLAADADDDGRFGGDGGVACTSTPPGPCESGRSSSAITATEPLQKLLNVQQQLYQDQGGQALFAPLLDCHDCHPASSSS